MKNKIYFLILLLFGLFSCSDLDEMNQDPNRPTADMYDFSRSQVSTLLRKGSTFDGAHMFQRVKSLHIDLYSQMLDEVPSGWTNTRNYFSNDNWTIDYWNSIPSWISSLNTIISSGLNDPNRVNSVAVARIWRVYVQSQATDLFGVMPFPSYKAYVPNPPYVSVQDQYKEFFTELDEAVKMINPAIGFLNAKEDMIFKGDVLKWKKFANSLRLRLALRVSEVDEAMCKTQAKAAIDGGVMESVADDAKCPPSNKGWGNDYNYTLLFAWGETQHMTSTFEKLTSNIGGISWPSNVAATIKPAKVDPRAIIMFNPVSDGTNITWKGVTPGLHPNKVNQEPFKKTQVAILGEYVVGPASGRKITRPYDIMLYEEVCFLKAEAGARGFVGGLNAKSEYENGVKSSFDRWGASGADLYLASNEKNIAGTSANFSDVSGSGNSVLEKIITQKYISLFPDVALEAWCDKRRLNLPRFDVLDYRDPVIFATAPNDFKDPLSFIKRVKIPSSESVNNKTEYDKGVALMGTGGDRTSTNLWWDKNKNYCSSEH